MGVTQIKLHGSPPPPLLLSLILPPPLLHPFLLFCQVFYLSQVLGALQYVTLCFVT